MSGSSFDGIEPHLSDSRSYLPGEETYLPDLTTELVSCYFTKERCGIVTGETSDIFSSLIRPHVQEDFDPRRFLDAVVCEASRAGGSSSFEFAGTFFSALVQSLYSLGFNGLSLDFSGTDFGGDLHAFGGWLTGTEDEPLSVSTGGIPILALGTFANCAAMRHDGDALMVGYYARSCDFTVTGEVDFCYIGGGAYDSLFRIVPEKILPHPDYPYLKGKPFERLLARELDGEGFFTRGNRLLFPGRDGEWREVTP